MHLRRLPRTSYAIPARGTTSMMTSTVRYTQHGTDNIDDIQHTTGKTNHALSQTFGASSNPILRRQQRRYTI